MPLRKSGLLINQHHYYIIFQKAAGNIDSLFKYEKVISMNPDGSRICVSFILLFLYISLRAIGCFSSFLGTSDMIHYSFLQSLPLSF